MSEATVVGIFVDETVAVAVSILFCTEVTVIVSGLFVGVATGSADCVVDWLGDGDEVSEAEDDCGAESVEEELEELSPVD